MKKKIALAIIALFSSTLLFAEAQYFDIEKAFANPKFKKLNAVKFEFGTDSNATVIRAGLKAHQKAKGAAKNPEKACQEALFKTLLRFQKTAKKMGLPKVVNLVGHYYDQEHNDKKTFQCWIANNVAGVLYYGDVAQ